jgi:hypothetical protein
MRSRPRCLGDGHVRAGDVIVIIPVAMWVRGTNNL